MAICPFILKKIGIPSIISLLLVGILIGQNGFGLNLIPKVSGFLYSLGINGSNETAVAEMTNYFNVFVHSLGSLGLIFLMALAGMEADFKLVKSCRQSVILLSVLTFAVPAITGYFIYRHFCPDDFSGKLLYASLFASHSVGIVFPVIRELNLNHTRYGASILISTVITDILSIILLAVSVQLFRHGSGAEALQINGSISLIDKLSGFFPKDFFLLFFLLVVIAYVFVTIFSINMFSKYLLKTLKSNDDILITVIMLVILLSVIVGEILGINLVVGAFIAGLGFSRSMQEEDMALFKRVESIGYGFLIPFLFVSIGMETDFSAFSSSNDVMIILLTIAGLVVSKIVSGYLAMRFSHYGNLESVAAGLMTVPQLSATLAAATIAKELGMLNANFFNAIIILSLVTTLPIPTLVNFLFHRRKVNAGSDCVSYPTPSVVEDEELL